MYALCPARHAMVLTSMDRTPNEILPTPPSTPTRGTKALIAIDDTDLFASPFAPDNALGLFIDEYVLHAGCRPRTSR
ncbi:hypothetical protein AURDEDRAFT_116122 [Auricularia subglabra TFB-10046 SS5]|uniref:Uncharacterized protein n=1 Tax=Auricularia subglabra (strain TFB-10046 / SS5) TaxID=717982 RepID=J0DC62_AURST|nr:hypothetical protein AURDEDRAFT_116122 [Auricularia subglabra TFB-10046 SS5]